MQIRLSEKHDQVNFCIRKDNKHMNEIIIWLFKESGKWYTEERFKIPESLTRVDQIIEYIYRVSV